MPRPPVAMASVSVAVLAAPVRAPTLADASLLVVEPPQLAAAGVATAGPPTLWLVPSPRWTSTPVGVLVSMATTSVIVTCEPARPATAPMVVAVPVQGGGRVGTRDDGQRAAAISSLLVLFKVCLVSLFFSSSCWRGVALYEPFCFF